MKYLCMLCSLLLLIHTGCNTPDHSRLNERASIRGLADLPENPLLLHALTTSLRPNDSSMSVLYGNNTAYNYALKQADGNYPNGSVLYEVNWHLQPDEQWFGARIPERISSVERLEFVDSTTRYEVFEKEELKKTIPVQAKERISFIRQEKIAIIP